MSDVKDLLQLARELPPAAREELAGLLLESLDAAIDADAEAAWSTEIDRRMRELQSGVARTVTWADARRRIAGSGT